MKAGLWREEVLARVGRIKSEASWVAPTLAAGSRATYIKENVTDRLDRAEYLAHDDRLDLIEWWSGSQIEDAWRELRLAEEALIRVTSKPAELTRLGHEALAHAKGRLADDDPSVEALRTSVDAAPPDDDERRALILSVMTRSHEASDRQHQTLRSFRNQLRVVAGALFLLAVGAIVLAVRLPTFPEGLVPAVGGIDGRAAVPVAMIAGAVGALFSAVPSLSQISEKATSFDPFREQAILKVAVGAWSGLIGIIVVAAGLGAAEATAQANGTVAGFTMVAALFGAGQEALTRFADSKASDVAPTTS